MPISPGRLAGGADMHVSSLTLMGHNGDARLLPSKVPHCKLRAGERLVSIGPCGGGYGDPLRRTPEAVLADVPDGLIPAKTAAREIGMVFKDGRVDRAGTAVARGA
jgi:N-methylhydantoinase B